LGPRRGAQRRSSLFRPLRAVNPRFLRPGLFTLPAQWTNTLEEWPRSWGPFSYASVPVISTIPQHLRHNCGSPLAPIKIACALAYHIPICSDGNARQL
jgi:hypothetical protein